MEIGTSSPNMNHFVSVSVLLLIVLVTYASAQSACSGQTVGSNSNVGSCTCNLLLSWCDTDCCCDPDCTTLQVATFSSCITQKPADPELCSVSSSIGCLSYDNYPDRLYYASKPITCDATTFQQNMTQYSSVPTFQPQLPTYPLLASFYRPGDPLYLLTSTSSVDYFILPRAAGTSSLCVDSIPAVYLAAQSTRCNRVIPTPVSCALTMLTAQTYCNGAFLQQPPTVTPTTVTSSTVVYSSTGVLTCTAAPAPTLNANQCQNVVTQVQYVITHNYQSGIQSVQTVITLGTVSATVVNQQFSITYTPLNFTAPSIPRSGNPGYLVGQPILAGLLSSDTRTGTSIPYISTTTNPYKQLTALSPLASPNSACLSCTGNANCYKPVLFGINYRSGCMVNMTYNNFSSNCNDISNILQNLLWPWNSTLVRVAAFGNYTTDQAYSFVPFTTNSQPQAASGSNGVCSNLVTGIALQFLYQRTNTLANPQMRIVGANYQFVTQSSLSFRCITPYCNTNNLQTAVQPLEVTVAVDFVDVSQPATMLEKLRPIFLAELPYNFFYPFGMSAAVSYSSDIWMLTSAVIFAVLWKF